MSVLGVLREPANVRIAGHQPTTRMPLGRLCLLSRTRLDAPLPGRSECTRCSAPGRANRELFWAVIGLPHRFDFVPILNVHTGFPFPRLDQDWNFIGAENSAGRLPVLLALTRRSSTR